MNEVGEMTFRYVVSIVSAFGVGLLALGYARKREIGAKDVGCLVGKIIGLICMVAIICGCLLSAWGR